ncbi:MAG: membrane dipeptidase [Hungatella sp.]|nr:membrane dipeptidase [Hungatella sp.]
MKVADMHCDTIAEIYYAQSRGEDVGIRSNHFQVDLEKMKQGDYAVQNFALFTSIAREKQPFEYAMNLLDVFYQEMEKNKDLISVATSYKDIEENRKAGRMSALLTIEEGAVCQGKLSYLRDFYRLGVRMMTLLWNHPNELGYPSCRDTRGSGSIGIPDTEHGLTETGIAFLEEMERLGMIIDVSHLNDAGVWDVFRYTQKPFVASHSNARALTNGCVRNLTDEMIRQMGDRGGVLGINYYPPFLRVPEVGKEEEKMKSRVSDMVRHIKHMRQVGGIGCIGLGSDFDGIGGDLEMKSCADLPILENEMRRQGFTESEIEAVFHGNVLRVYKEVLL